MYLIQITVLVLIESLIGFSQTSDIRAVDLKCEYLSNPLAVDSRQPRLSWTFESTLPTIGQNLSQLAYQVLVASDEDSLAKDVGNLWDSKKVVSDKNVHVKYNGKQLAKDERAYWAVKVWDQNDKESNYSKVALWINGPDMSDWTAQWIGAPIDTQKKALANLAADDDKLVKELPGLVPILYLRKIFTAESNIKSAILYATAQGVYKILLNGQYVSNSELSPGWTDFTKIIQYQAYNVKHMLINNNVIGAQLATGWKSGYVGPGHHYNLYGADQNLFFELRIEYENNKKVVIASDNTWKVTTGPVIYSDMLMGELYYQNRELIGWTSTTYDDKNWLSVVTKAIDRKVVLIADRAEPMRVVEEVTAKSKLQISPGVWVFDLGQNMVGWVRIWIPGSAKSSRVQLRHAEMVNPNGSVYTLNLGGVRAIDTYVLDSKISKNDIILEPHFTFHGFRYVEITGYPGEPQLSDITGRVMNTDSEIIGRFKSSNQLVNKLYENQLWSQKGNFRSVPDGCPQRDERLGWSGDAEFFSHTSTYNAYVAPFFTKWMRDMRNAQSAQGGFPDIAPRVSDMADGAPAWGDAGVIIPYTVYRMFGDLQIIEENYEAMQKWINYIGFANPDFIWTKLVGYNWGDWLQVNDNTPKEVLSTAYYAYDALLMSRMAKAVNRTADSAKYSKLHSDIANAFVKAFVNTTDGKIKGDSQTDYLLALAFELLPDNLQPLAVKNLVDNIKAHDWHLTTGFVGVGHLCPILTRFDQNEVAYKLLLQTTYPSWGYNILNGATTIWERWDGWTKDKGFQDPNMNSFNHYSLGSVGRWLFQSVAGIDTDEEEVGFKKIIIKPNPGTGLSFVSSSYKSINGLISSNWEIIGNKFRLNTTIPINTKAVIDLRFAKSGKAYEVGSGYYEYEVDLN